MSEVVLRAWAINFLEGFVFEPNEGGKVGLQFFEDVIPCGETTHFKGMIDAFGAVANLRWRFKREKS
jgi:hypothetical protein